MTLRTALETLRPAMVLAAQDVLDEWEQDEEGFDIELGAGGACDQVMEALSGIISSEIEGVEIVEGGWEGDDHAWIIVADNKKAWGVDLPAGIYERGSCYRWTKIPDVILDPSDIEIFPVPLEDVFIEGRLRSNSTPVTYGAYHRPVDFATVPSGYTAVGTHPDFKSFGTVTYPEALDKSQAEHFSLIEIPTQSRRDELIFFVVAELAEYRDDHLEEAEEEPRFFRQMIGKFLAGENVHISVEGFAEDVYNALKAS